MIAEIEKNIVWDIVVIGGGSTGLGTALEAATRGYKVLLVEQSDFAKSTSGKSTKLIHGGVRYLAQGNIRLVREANIERGLLIKNAPHLVSDQQFIIPIYSFWQKIKFFTGLKLYDWIAGWSSLGATKYINAKEVAIALPALKTKGLLGGVLYHDGRFDDARFALELAGSIFKNNGFAINYFKVDSIDKHEGKICGITGTDVISGILYNMQAKVVVNATGVFADDILQMDESSSPKTLSVSQGIHLVFDKHIFDSKDALMIPETKDGRVLFIIPWHNKVLVGTTDTAVKNTSLEPVASDSEINFILETLQAYLQTPVSRADIKSMFAGLRPLAAPVDSTHTKEISRGHKIMISASGLFTIIGGKWTTYRKMGEDLIDEIEQQLKWNATKSVTASVPIGSVDERSYAQNEPIENLKEEGLSQNINLTTSLINRSVEENMALTVDDMLSRRTRLLLLDAAEAVRIAPQVAAIMAKTLNKNDGWIQEQVASFNQIAKNYMA